MDKTTDFKTGLLVALIAVTPVLPKAQAQVPEESAVSQQVTETQLLRSPDRSTAGWTAVYIRICKSSFHACHWSVAPRNPTENLAKSGVILGHTPANSP
ncbi:MAG: hypothetical protein AB3N23_10625 [Paracoccaceae bacterium]